MPVLHVTPPSWRRDIDGPADLVEEVVRIHGLAEVPSVALSRDTAVAKPVLTAGTAPRPQPCGGRWRRAASMSVSAFPSSRVSQAQPIRRRR